MKLRCKFAESKQGFKANFSETVSINGATFYPSISEDGILSWTNDKGLENPPSVNIRGAQGKSGKDGYTPQKGVDYFDGVNGKDGKDGKDGIDGKDGYTPQKGVDYFDGKDGADGFSPIVAVEDIKGGHRVTITDKNGGKSFDVMNGTDGQGGAGGGVSFIDVLNELPTENIQTGMFYRLTTGVFAYEGSIEAHHTIYCVTELPEVGEPVTDANRSAIVAYFNINSRTIHGYIDGMLSAGLGIPSGWYGKELFDAFGVAYGGVIADVSESEGKDALCVLIAHQMYFYDNGWCEAAFGYEKVPEFDITWDGEIGNLTALDMSMLGYDPGTYFVKISDDVFTTEELVGWTYNIRYTDGSAYDERVIEEYAFDTTTYPGAFTIDNWIVVLHDAAALATALGIPTGIYPNGIYFFLDTDYYVSRLVAPSKVTKIDSKFMGVHPVAYTGNYNDLENTPAIYTDVVRYSSQYLSSTQKSYARSNIDVYSKSEVDQKLANSGGNVDLSGYAKTSDLASYAKTSDVSALEAQIGDISAALDELHAYAQSKINGGDS